MSSSSALAVSRRRRLWLRLSAWVPVLFCIGVITVESTPSYGADHTSGPLRWLVEHLLHHQFRGSEWWHIHMAIRKAGHFVGYGILSLSWFRAFWMTVSSDAPRRRLAAHALAILGTLMVATADEFHQSFLPNRNGTPVDVVIDCSGALLLQGIVALAMTLVQRRTARRQVAVLS